MPRIEGFPNTPAPQKRGGLTRAMNKWNRMSNLTNNQLVKLIPGNRNAMNKLMQIRGVQHVKKLVNAGRIFNEPSLNKFNRAYTNYVLAHGNTRNLKVLMNSGMLTLPEFRIAERRLASLHAPSSNYKMYSTANLQRLLNRIEKTTINKKNPMYMRTTKAIRNVLAIRPNRRG